MKAKFLNFRGSNLFSGICLTTMLICCLSACAGIPPQGETRTAAASKPAAEAPAGVESPSSSTVSPQPSTQESSPSSEVRETGTPVHLELIFRAYLRAEPSSKGKIIAKLKKGEKVIRLGASGSWVQVELSDKTTGWILKKQVREEK